MSIVGTVSFAFVFCCACLVFACFLCVLGGCRCVCFCCVVLLCVFWFIRCVLSVPCCLFCIWDSVSCVFVVSLSFVCLACLLWLCYFVVWFVIR